MSSGWMPYELFRNPHISDKAVRLYAFLKYHAGGGNFCEITRENLAKDMNTSIGTVHRSLKELKQTHWVEIQSNGKGMRCLIRDTSEASPMRPPLTREASSPPEASPMQLQKPHQRGTATILTPPLFTKERAPLKSNETLTDEMLITAFYEKIGQSPPVGDKLAKDQKHLVALKAKFTLPEILQAAIWTATHKKPNGFGLVVHCAGEALAQQKQQTRVETHTRSVQAHTQALAQRSDDLEDQQNAVRETRWQALPTETQATLEKQARNKLADLGAKPEQAFYPKLLHGQCLQLMEKLPDTRATSNEKRETSHEKRETNHDSL